jgi:hypothetical protein
MRYPAVRHALFIAVAIAATGTHARVFLTGSNPMLSTIALPQELLLIPGGDKLSFYTAWQTFPWWGDIDEPENRPYKKYVLTGQKTDEIERYASINQFDERISFTRWRNDKFRTSYEIGLSGQRLSADAQNYAEAPYVYHEQHSIRDGYLKAILATYYKTLPIGMSLSLGGIQTSQPISEFYVGNSQQSSPRLLWGWDGDGFQNQDEFALGWLFKGDAQLGVSLKNDRIGSHFRIYTGSLRNYNWDDSTSSYDITPKKIHNYTIRLYGIHNWYKQDNFKFNTTVLTRYTFVDSIGLNSWDRNAPVDFKQIARTFVFQINPNVNIYPWKYPMSFIDVAILCNYQHMNYNFLNERDMYQYSGWWGNVDDYSWERPSYARENFFELALDIFASIPVFGMKEQSAGVAISALLWRRYKWMNKYFGHSDWQTGDFTTTNIRKNFDKETWLNAVFNIFYRRGSVMYRLDIGQPLIYSLTPRTTVYDADGNVEAGKTMEKMWLSQSGFKIGLFVSTDLTNFIRYQPFARPPATR